MKWVYSDPHFFHNNVIQYCSRPFKNIEEMQEVIVNNHNNTIDKKDKVFILGDIALANKEKTTKVIKRLKGQLVLVMGNHDKSRSRQWWLDCGFDQVIEYPILLNNFFILSHEPVYLSSNMPYINIHGHLHGNILLDKNTYQEAMAESLTLRVKPLKEFNYNRYINVCLDNTDFKPVDLNQIINKFTQ